MVWELQTDWCWSICDKYSVVNLLEKNECPVHMSNVYTVYIVYLYLVYVYLQLLSNVITSEIPNFGQGTAAKDLTPFCLKFGRWLKKRPIATCAKEPSSPGSKKMLMISFLTVVFFFLLFLFFEGEIKQRGSQIIIWNTPENTKGSCVAKALKLQNLLKKTLSFEAKQKNTKHIFSAPTIPTNIDCSLSTVATFQGRLHGAKSNGVWECWVVNPLFCLSMPRSLPKKIEDLARLRDNDGH